METLITENDNNPFIFALSSIKRSIEVCRDNNIQEEIKDPNLLAALSMVYAELAKYSLK